MQADFEGKDVEHDVLNCLCLNLRRTARQVTQVFDRALKPVRLKITQFTLLAAIGHFERTTHIPLAEFMGMDRTTLTRNLAVLQQGGYVSIEQGTNDRREQFVQLTANGRMIVQRAMPLWQKAQAELIAALGQAGTQSLLSGLEQLTSKR